MGWGVSTLLSWDSQWLRLIICIDTSGVFVTSCRGMTLKAVSKQFIQSLPSVVLSHTAPLCLQKSQPGADVRESCCAHSHFVKEWAQTTFLPQN